MQARKLDLNRLEEIRQQIIDTMNKGKQEIFSIAESACTEAERIKKKLAEVQGQAAKVITEVDDCERKYRVARLRLMEVSRNFNRYSEADIKAAYEAAQTYQTQLAVLRERESSIRERRDDLMRMLKNLQQGVKKADNLATKFSTITGYLQGTLSDLTDQLEDMQQGQMLGLRVIKAQEEERWRVARDIHDGPAQTLANVVLRAEICEKLLDTDPTSVREELAQLKTTVRNSLMDIRRIIYDLRPMTLDDLGLVPTIRRMVNDFTERYQMDINFKFHGREERLNTVLEVAVFRIIQECLNNIVKHANASKVSVILEYTGSEILISVRDNGRGFNKDEVFSMSEGEHYGLLSMRERVKLLDGEFSIETAPGRGTRIFSRIPVANSEVTQNG